MSAPAPPHSDGPAPDALAAALLASPHVLALLLDGTGRVVRAGAGCERLTGRSPADAKGRPAWECVFAARSGPVFRAAIARAAAGESAVEVETECSAADGTRRRI